MKKLLIHTMPGIGDNIWVYQKLFNYFDKFVFHVREVVGNPYVKPDATRSFELLKQLPKVENVVYFKQKDAPHLIVEDKYYSVQELIDAHKKDPNQIYTYSCNKPLELGIRIENIDHQHKILEKINLPTSNDLPHELKNISYWTMYISDGSFYIPQALDVKKNNKKNEWFIANNFNKLCFGEIRKNNQIWEIGEWVALFETLQKYLYVPCVLIGAKYDEKAIKAFCDRVNPFYKNNNLLHVKVNMPIKMTNNVIKNSKYFLGFQSGLNVIADQFNVPQGMIYINRLSHMIYSWPNKNNIITEKYKPVVFKDGFRKSEVIFINQLKKLNFF